MGDSIGVCLGNRLGAAWAGSGRFQREIRAYLGEKHPLSPAWIPPQGTEGKELNCRPQARRRNGGNTAGRRAGAGPPHLLSGGLNVHGYI